MFRSIQRGLQSYHVAIKSLLYNNNECMNEIVREVGIVCFTVYDN